MYFPGETEVVKDFLRGYNASQRILLMSASRALVTEEKVVGKNFFQKCRDCDSTLMEHFDKRLFKIVFINIFYLSSDSRVQGIHFLPTV